MKTSELTGIALDWAVAKCEGDVTELMYDGIIWGFKLDGKMKVLAKGWAASLTWNPSTNWAQGGAIIEREQIEVRVHEGSRVKCEWKSGHWDEDKGVCVWSVGPTPLIAAMRCYVASILGDEVETPKGLT